MAWLVSKQGVYRPSGQGCPAKYEARQSEAETRAKFDTPGQNERPCEEQTKADADKISCKEIFLFELVLNCDKITIYD